VPDLYDAFGHLDDEGWRQLLLRSLDEGCIDGVTMPRFPPEEEQRLFTSWSRERALEEAFAFFRIVKEACQQLGSPLGPDSRLLDFGVGWGRIVRTFMKDVPARNIVGIDVNEHAIERCRSLVSFGRYLLWRSGEPLPLETAEVDVVTAFSVFSHLSAEAGLEAIAELGRVLRPGGLAVVTTLSGRFLDYCRTAAAAPRPDRFQADIAGQVRTAYPDWDTRLAQWPGDDLFFLPTGGGIQGAAADSYGWAMVPPGYARRAWAPWFEVVEHVDDQRILEQAYLVLRRRGGTREAAVETTPRTSWTGGFVRLVNGLLARGDLRFGRRSTHEGFLRAMVGLERELAASRSLRSRLEEERAELMQQLTQRTSGPVAQAAWKALLDGVAADGSPLPFLLRSIGRCPICEAESVFVAKDPWLRDHLVCQGCWSIPRERALMHVLQTHFPDWRAAALHESSPSPAAASNKLRRECPGYVGSQYWPDVAAGSLRDGVRCEDLERQTFADESLDLVVTQDVMEHVIDPQAAFREIARTLRPGGAHVFTTPIHPDLATSVVRARRVGGEIEHLEPPAYHGNPIDPRGALVTIDYGRDLPALVERASGLRVEVLTFDDAGAGLLGRFLDVVIARKSGDSRPMQ
jgi:ubiquinone/menaquinone biosynthesis C-methylase UbiE